MAAVTIVCPQPAAIAAAVVAAAAAASAAALPPGAVKIPLILQWWDASFFQPVETESYPLEWDQFYNIVQEINSAIANVVLVRYKWLWAFASIAAMIFGMLVFVMAMAAYQLLWALIGIGLCAIAIFGALACNAEASRQCQEALDGKIAEVNARLKPQEVEFVYNEEFVLQGEEGRLRQVKVISLIVRRLLRETPAVTVVGAAAPSVDVATVVVKVEPTSVPASVDNSNVPEEEEEVSASLRGDV